MDELLKRLQTLDKNNINPETLKRIVSSLDLKNIAYKSYLHESNNRDYSRIQLMSTPFDVELMQWQPSRESAIHKHCGFWGHVIVLEGTGKETVYNWDGKTLSWLKELELTPLIHGPVTADSVHSVKNLSDTETFVTLHIYYPPQKGMQNTWIFDVHQKKIGILNEHAKSASWKEPASSFDNILHNAFVYKDNAFVL
ncbi:MAG: cysteine dioxygenase family protein [Bacteroidales bacterium]